MSTVSSSSSEPRPEHGTSAPDPSLVEQTKQQIRSLVAEIAELAKADVTPEQFYQQFLDRVVSALAAVGGAVWTIDSENRLSLQYQINLQATRLRDDEAALQRHGRLLGQVITDGGTILVPPNSGGEGDEAGNPTSFLLVLGALKTDLEAVGVVEIFQRNDAGPNTQRGYLRFLSQMCDLAGDFLKSHQLRHFSHRQVLWTQLEDFCRVVHASLNPRETAYTIGNEGRRLIQCDRLSIAINHGGKCRIEAISGQDIFDRRANAVRLLEQLATAVTQAGDPMWYTGDTSDLPPQVEDAVQAYVDEAHSKTVAVLPLKRPQADRDETDNQHEPEPPPLGALIVEQIEDSRVPPGLAQRTEVVARHSETALANALDHDSIFLMPVWRAIGQSRLLTKTRNLPWTVSIGGGVLLVLLVLCLWRAPFRMEAKGDLQPVIRRNVYANTKGRVEEINVKHDEMVVENQRLLLLRDTELEVAIDGVKGERLSTISAIASVERQQLDPSGMKIEEKNRLAGELAVQRARLATLDSQWHLYQEKKKDLEVTSPIAGKVITWDLENRLRNLPVDRGQVLLTVADEEGDWQIELRMPEQDMGYVADAYNAAVAKGEKLPVSFQLATDPGRTFEGTVTEVHRGAEVHGEEGNTVLIKVAIDKNELPDLRPGTTATGKVYCGYRPLGFVWFHDVWNFIQTQVLFRYF